MKFRKILLCFINNVIKETTNRFFQVTFDSSSSHFSCQFTVSVGNGSKSCSFVYGLKDTATNKSSRCLSSNMSVKSKAENTTDSSNTDTVFVSIPPLAQTGSEVCFIAIGTTATLSLAVEGTFVIVKSMFN